MSRRELFSYLMASLPSDHADVFGARVGTSQQLDENLFMAMSSSTFIPTPDQTASERRPAGRSQRQRDASHLHWIKVTEYLSLKSSWTWPRHNSQKSSQIFVKVVPTAYRRAQRRFSKQNPAPSRSQFDLHVK